MVRTPCWLVVCALLVAVHLPTPAVAQGASAKRDSAVTRLETGQQIRITAEGMARLVGNAGVVSHDTLDFAQDDMVRRIPIQAIDTLWTRGRATSTGAIIGGVTGAVLGMLAGAVGAGLCEYDCSSTGGAVAVVGAIGAVAGTGLGALIGAAIPKWKRRFP